MNHLLIGPPRARLTLLPVLVFLVMLAGAVHAAGAAAYVKNPDEALIARWEPCEPDTGVTVIVDDRKLGEGKIYVGCAIGEQADGVEALQHAGFQLEGTTAYGLNFLCRIEGEPTPAEESCITTPGPGAYWSYWHGRPGGRWGYSDTGAEGYKPALGSVEGWSFGGGDGPRIEPMDGSGPSSFRLPLAQESSVIPAALAREWLTSVTLKNVSMIEEGAEAGGEKVLATEAVIERLLRQAVVLAQAGVKPAKLTPIAGWLARTCEEKGVSVGSCVLRSYADPHAPPSEQRPGRFATAVLGLQALGENPSSFAGMNLRGTLEGMIEAGTGRVEYAGRPSEEVEDLAPTVLALARTGTLTAKALESVDLILAGQNASTGSFANTVATEVEAIQALSAAREQGASVLGQSRVEAIEAALVKAGGYLEGIQEPDGGIPPQKGSESDVESTSLGAVGLVLAGRESTGERAAKSVSRYQVTAEYAGIGNAETGEHTPAEELIGAFLPEEAALRNTLVYGDPGSQYGPYAEAQQATWPALLALMTAGPYGPYDAVFDQESLFFESRPVGSSSKLTATLTNQDVRPVTITTVSVSGSEPADFSIAGGNCAGRKLAPGETCEAQVGFDPVTLGLHTAQLQASLQGTGQTIQIPLDGTGIPAPEPEPQPKTESGPGPVVGPSSSTPAPGHTASGLVVGLAVESIGPARLLLKFTAPGVATVKIARLRGKGHHRDFQTVKTISIKASKAGTLEIRLPRLAAGSYRVSISLAGTKTVVKTLTVPGRRR